MGLHAGHLLGYQDISRALDFISVNGAKNLCLGDQYGIIEGRPANFILLDAKDDYEAIRFLSPVLLSVHNGKILAQKQPAHAAVFDI